MLSVLNFRCLSGHYGMAELVLAVIGVLPVILEALKSYRAIHDKVRTFSNCCQELAWIQRRLNTQKLKFFYNCERLIRLKLRQNEDLEDLIDNSKQSFWFEESPNTKIRNALGRITVDLLEGTIAEVQTILQDFDADLQCLDVIKSEMCEVIFLSINLCIALSNTTFLQGESLKKAFRRLRQSFTIVIEKSRFSKHLDMLQSLNEDLKGLVEDSIDWASNEQRRKLAESKAVASSSVVEYNMVQRAAEKLHEALNGAWCCNGLGHTHHCAKLCVDAQVSRGVRLDLAISYGKHSAQDIGRCDRLRREIGSLANISLLVTLQTIIPLGCTSNRPAPRLDQPSQARKEGCRAPKTVTAKVILIVQRCVALQLKRLEVAIL